MYLVEVVEEKIVEGSEIKNDEERKDRKERP